jgi:hypothetical protein
MLISHQRSKATLNAVSSWAASSTIITASKTLHSSSFRLHSRSIFKERTTGELLSNLDSRLRPEIGGQFYVAQEVLIAFIFAHAILSASYGQYHTESHSAIKITPSHPDELRP